MNNAVARRNAQVPPRGRLRAAFLLGIAALLLPACEALTRNWLFFPTRYDRDAGLTRWMHQGRYIGLAREVAAPENVWLMLHGNAGQAADRAAILGAFSPDDSVYVMEYPGYGMRAGKPSRGSFDAAAREAYEALRVRFAGTPVCVVGESIGSGPAATLGAMPRPPDKLVLVVPFDDLASVARDHAPIGSAGRLFAGYWNNVELLADYRGPMDVFGARGDEVIDVRHARALAASRPQARFHLFEGSHNGWSRRPDVMIRNP